MLKFWPGFFPQAIEFVRERLLKGMTPKAIAEALCERCLAPNTDGCGKGCDNMSVLITVMKQYSSGLPPPDPSVAVPTPPFSLADEDPLDTSS